MGSASEVENDQDVACTLRPPPPWQEQYGTPTTTMIYARTTTSMKPTRPTSSTWSMSAARSNVWRTWWGANARYSCDYNTSLGARWSVDILSGLITQSGGSGATRLRRGGATVPLTILRRRRGRRDEMRGAARTRRHSAR